MSDTIIAFLVGMGVGGAVVCAAMLLLWIAWIARFGGDDEKK